MYTRVVHMAIAVTQLDAEMKTPLLFLRRMLC